MKIACSVFTTLQHLKNSVHAQYGSGVIGYVQYIYYSLLRVNTFLIYSRSNEDDTINTITISSKLTVKRRGRVELDELRQNRRLPREFHGDRLLGSKDFFLAFWEKEPAYIHWVISAGSRSRFLVLDGNCAEISYMLTLPEYRGQRICSQVMAHSAHVLMKEGVRQIFCVIHDHNIASMKSAEHAGFRIFGTVRSIGPLNFRRKVMVK